jgi:hypothetical protein
MPILALWVVIPCALVLHGYRELSYGLHMNRSLGNSNECKLVCLHIIIISTTTMMMMMMSVVPLRT